MPVQWVNRPNLDFRGFSGLIATGSVRPGDPVRVVPSGRTLSVSRVVTMDGDLDEAGAGQSVTICLSDEIDCPRGDLLLSAHAPSQFADHVRNSVVSGQCVSLPL